jgi:carbamate kinase
VSLNDSVPTTGGSAQDRQMLGGNAVRQDVTIAAHATAPLAAEHSVVVAHGNGPQVGLLSLQAGSYAGAGPYPLDVLDAGTKAMTGYLIQQNCGAPRHRSSRW